MQTLRVWRERMSDKKHDMQHWQSDYKYKPDNVNKGIKLIPYDTIKPIVEVWEKYKDKGVKAFNHETKTFVPSLSIEEYQDLWQAITETIKNANTGDGK